MRKIKYLSILVIAGLFASCVKQGPAGPQGENGANGTANITATYDSVPVSSWTYNAGVSEWFFDTPQIIPNGDGVLVYESLGSNVFEPLPAYNTFASGDVVTFKYGNGAALSIWYYNAASPSTKPTAKLTIEIVDIPPAMHVKYPKVNWSNYNEVSALPEFQIAQAKVK